MKEESSFWKGIKWGSGVGLGCGGFLFLIFVFFIIVITVIGAIISFKSKVSVSLPFNETVIEGEGTDKIALIPINGEIVSDTTYSSINQINAQDIISILKQIEKDDNVKAVVLKINSPGGSVTSVDEVYQKLKSLKSKKKIIASFGETGASGAYYLAAVGEKILANPTSIVGSIGVILQIPNLEGTFEKIGYKEVVIKSGNLKDIGSYNRAMTDEEKKILQDMTDEVYNRFVDVVAVGRRMDKKEVLPLADGRIYTGQQAKNLKLIDDFGDIDTAINQAKSLAGLSQAKVVEYETPMGLIRSLLKEVSRLKMLFGLDLNREPILKYKWSGY